MLPDEAIKHADSVVLEAEPVWADLLRDLQQGQLKKFYQVLPAGDQLSIPWSP